jgi:hypothetical protein
MDEITVRDPKRSAHATIRGYLYQVCLGVLRWLDLEPNELLLLEGDEDLDRILCGERSCEQVRYRSHDLGLGDRAVTKSLVVFVTAFKELTEAGEQRRFIFTSNAAVRDKYAEVFKGWEKPERRADVIAAIRKAIGEQAPGPIAWLDADNKRWSRFIEAVEWRFETGSVDDLMTEIADRLRQELRELSRLLQPRARQRPADMDNPASLLRAEYQVVRFFEPGRLDLLQRLAEWCDSAKVASVQLLYGASQEAVDILRQLASDCPDAFLPDLATSLNNLCDRLAELERPDEALAAAHEAVVILAPIFLALPSAHARRMSYMFDDYLARAAAVGQDPDSDLVDPIRQALEQLDD